MTDNVHALHGGEVIVAGEPSESAIEMAETLLEKARCGEVQGFAVAMLHPDRCSSWTLAGRIGGNSIIGACYSMTDEVRRWVHEE